MTTQYVVTDDELTAVADAIRTKGGTEADLEWYSDFVTAIGAITGGGGSGGGGNALVSEGTFTSANTQYGVVDVDCGFEPDAIMVSLPINSKDTTSFWIKGASWAEDKAMWCLQPAESATYVVNLDRQSGETGIQAINSNGFSFMSNASNTRGVTCKYIAVKYTNVPSGGGSTNILSGTDTPTASQGSNGDVYLQYIVLPTVRYVRFTINGTRAGTDVQLSDIDFVDGNGDRFEYPSETIATSDATPGYWAGAYQDAEKLIDNNHNTKFYSGSYTAPSNIDFDLGSAALDLSVYNTWKWYTADDSQNRDPISFSLSVSTDGVNYTILDSVTNATITTNRKTEAYSKTFETGITAVYCKLSGTWQNLIGTDIDDVNTGGGATSEIETVAHYAWTYSGYSGFAVMNKSDGEVIGKVAINNANEILQGNLMEFSYYGNGTGGLTVTALEDITLTAYVVSTSTSGTITGTEYQLSSGDSQAFTSQNYGGGYLFVAEKDS